MATRRRRGEDGISFEHRGPCRDPQRHRNCPGLWRGELTLGYTPDGKRQRRKVSGQTKAAVIDKLRDLHTQLDKGITPKSGYVHYTVRQAAEDWLATGLDGRSAKTIKKNPPAAPRATAYTSQPPIPGYLTSGSTADDHTADPAGHHRTCPTGPRHQFITPTLGGFSRS